AKDVAGLLMAGRCISGDFWAHSSYRVTGNAVAMGEAAGKYAASQR
ncbi:MAG: FAD-dependent oxidoreductase, partial [Lentisphaeria bacterium]|nr:FAD-dependent oxidoreductase [Lentisphaeria bacterium]